MARLAIRCIAISLNLFFCTLPVAVIGNPSFSMNMYLGILKWEIWTKKIQKRKFSEVYLYGLWFYRIINKPQTFPLLYAFMSASVIVAPSLTMTLAHTSSPIRWSGIPYTCDKQRLLTYLVRVKYILEEYWNNILKT